MPRIPSAADVSPVGGSAGRLPTVRAGADDLGFSIAQGLASFGKGVGNVGDRQSAEARKKAAGQKTEEEAGEAPPKEDQLAQTTGLLETLKLQAKARTIGNGLIADMERGATVPGSAAQDVIKAFDRSIRDLVETLPSEWQAQAEGAIAPVRESVAVRARQRAHNQAVEGVMQDTQEVLQSLTTLALREPEAAEHYVAEGEALLQSLVRTGAFTQAQYAAQSEAFRRSLYTKLLRSQSAIDAVADLEAGVYDEALDDPALRELLLKESTQRLELERAQGVAGTNWLVAQARRGTAAPAELLERNARVLGEEESAETQVRLDRVGRVRSALEALRYAPEAALWRGMAELPLAWDIEDAREVLETQEEFRVQAEEMLRQRRDDPAAYVMEQPAVTAAFAAAAKDPSLLPDAVGARLAAQVAMGLAPEAQNALTMDERRQVAEGLQRLEPEQRIAALMELGKAYGNQSAAVAADLAEAGLTLSDLLAADPSGGPEVSGRLARAGQGQSVAKSPESSVIDEAAEKRIDGERKAAISPLSIREGGWVKGYPPVPHRKPYALEHPDIKALANEHHDLLHSSDEALKAGIKPRSLRNIEPWADFIDSEADLMGVHPIQREIAKRLLVVGVKEGLDILTAASAALDVSRIRPKEMIEQGLAPYPSKILDTSAHFPVVQGTEGERARHLIEAGKLGMDQLDFYDHPGSLSLVKDLLRIREIYRLEGELGKEKLIARAEAIEQSISDQYGGIPNSPAKQIRVVADRVLEKPYAYPMVLTDDELKAGIYYLSGTLADSADKPPYVSALGLAMSLFPASKLAKWVNIATGALGLSSDLSTKEMSLSLEGMVAESSRRRNFTFDPRILEEMGLH